ncbi:hypothetical protein DI272_19155 [Streptomyces sp. Act143]|nr:hypothetical protein DI272_19155 [Streptomyces sp. Act143]
MSERPPLVVAEALLRAAAGDHVDGGMLLAPLIEEGRASTYALAGMLAEAASHIARRDQRPGAMFGIQIDHVVTGEPGRPEDLPPDVAFAAQFTTAWANRDQDTAMALFNVLADGATGSEAGSDALIDGLLALFELAVITTRVVIAEQRNNPNQQKG